MLPKDERQPSSEWLPWPPVDWMYKQEVTLDDHWGSVAAKWGRKATDLLIYNFGTTNPDEVNWYLRHRIGCDKMTADKENYRFGSSVAGKQLFVYIPHPWWTAREVEDDLARQAAMVTLLGPTAMGLSFTMAGLSVRLADTKLVADAIALNRIDVRYVPTLPTYAEYRPVSHDGLPGNMLRMSYHSTGSLANAASVIHEAVHAVHDIRKVATFRLLEEGVAYVAEQLYRLRRGGAHPTPEGRAFAIKTYAWDIAGEIHAGRPVPTLMESELFAAIAQHPVYRPTCWKPIAFDGVP